MTMLVTILMVMVMTIMGGGDMMTPVMLSEVVLRLKVSRQIKNGRPDKNRIL